MNSTLGRCARTSIVLMSLLAALPAAQAATIEFFAVDLADTVAGQDRWSYEYSLTGSFSPFDGVNLLFASNRYKDLVLTVPPDPTVWLSSITDPNELLSADGIVALLNMAGPDPIEVTKLPFTLEFTWLLTGRPGSQAFEVFDNNFNVVETGTTTDVAIQAVPEPGLITLTLMGLMLIGAQRSRRPN